MSVRVTLWSQEGLKYFEDVQTVETEFGSENTVYLTFADAPEEIVTGNGLVVKDLTIHDSE